MNNLITYYVEKFNLQNATLIRIEHEDALVAVVYKVQSSDREYILKICTRTHDYLCEVYFLNYLADKLPVPHIIKMIQPRADAYGAILMEYIHGNLLKTTEFTATLAYEIGSLLAKIHTNKAAGYGDLTQNHLSSDPILFYF
jgi:tRNA A-37 threonylcarbamoyl transferase component Bud32